MSRLDAPATREQLEGAYALVLLALEEEEGNELELSKIREFGRKITYWMTSSRSRLDQVRDLVVGLRNAALPKGKLYDAAGAWLALAENGGAA